MTTEDITQISSTQNSQNIPEKSNLLLRECVQTAMTNYLSSLDGQPATSIYQMVMTEVETPLLETVMKYTNNNQSKAAKLLGINRGTLRNKLKQYDIE